MAENIEMSFESRTPKSRAIEERGLASLPIVSSRGNSHHFPYPLTIARARSAHVWDADGRCYIDLINNMYSLAHGNAFEPINEAVRSQLENGTVWPANSESTVHLAECLRARMPSLDKILFCNSGTEAFSLALNLARGFTGRHRFLMARGAYHGQGWDTLQGSKGLDGPNHFVEDFGDTEAFVASIERNRDALCAVFLEPFLCAGGLTEAPAGFLHAVQQACARCGVLFVLDEIVSFRLSQGGFQGMHRLRPDLTMLGKVIGGGFPVGAVGGRADILTQTSPAGGFRVSASGTFSANAITTTAGLVSVSHLTQRKIDDLAVLACRLEDGMLQAAQRAGTRIWTRRLGSIVNWFFYDPGNQPALLQQRPDQHQLKAHHLALLNEGVFAVPRASMVLSTPMTADLIDDVVERFGASLSHLAS